MLVDSRAVVERTCRRWALRHHLDPERVLQIAHGRRTRDTVRAAAPHLETDREAAWLDAAELADVDGLSAVPGASQFLAGLPTNRWAVVTSRGRALAELRLTSVGLPIPIWCRRDDSPISPPFTCVGSTLRSSLRRTKSSVLGPGRGGCTPTTELRVSAPRGEVAEWLKAAVC